VSRNRSVSYYMGYAIQKTMPPAGWARKLSSAQRAVLSSYGRIVNYLSVNEQYLV